MTTEDFSSEAELFEEEALARRALEQRSEATANVVMDLQDRGPLYSYITELRDEAAAALVALADVDPTDVSKIIKLQRIANLYTDAVDWVHRKIADGEEVEQQINEVFGGGEKQEG